MIDRRIITLILTTLLTFSAGCASAIPPIGSPTPFRDESVILVEINSDMSANLTGVIHRPFSPIDFSYYTRRAVPLAMGLRYEGFIELKRVGDSLEGTYRLYVTPNLLEGADKDLAMKLWNSLQRLGSPYLALQGLMKVLFGEGFLFIPRPTVRTDIAVNFTDPFTGESLIGRGLSVEAPVRSETPFFEEYRVHFVLQSPPPPISPDWVGDLFYEIEAKTTPFSEPYPVSKEEGVLKVILDPITTALPKGAPYTLCVKERLPEYEVSSGTPVPVKIHRDEAIWELSGLEKPEGLALELVKVESGGLVMVGALSIWTALVPPAISASILAYSLIRKKRGRGV